MDNTRRTNTPNPLPFVARRWAPAALTLLLCLVCSVALTTSLHAAPARPADVVITDCSNDSQLRNAITSASGTVTIQINCGGAATLPFSSFIAVGNATDITVDGGGGVIFDGANLSAFFQVSTQGALTLRNLTIHRGQFSGAHPLEVFGQLTLENVKIESNTINGDGAAVFVNGNGALTVRNSAFSFNTAQPPSGGKGGAIYSDGALSVFNTTFSNNTASGGAGGSAAGGAIAIGAGTATVISSTFTSNHIGTTLGIGGAIAHLGGSLIVTATTFRTNAAPDGGALFLSLGAQMTVTNALFEGNVGRYAGAIESAGELHVDNTQFLTNKALPGAGGALWLLNGNGTVTDSTFTGNTSALSGGAIECDNQSISIAASTFGGNRAATNGGAIYSACNLNLVNSTLSANEAIQGGGGLYQTGAGAVSTVGASTIANNKAAFGAGVYNDGSGVLPSTLSLRMTLLADNTTGNCDGVVASLGYNLSSDTNCASFTQTGDAQNLSLALGQLANNGGPTYTRVPLPGNPAINRVPAASCPYTSDQRHLPRPYNNKCDVGAVEATPSLYLPTVKRD